MLRDISSEHATLRKEDLLVECAGTLAAHMIQEDETIRGLSICIIVCLTTPVPWSSVDAHFWGRSCSASSRRRRLW